MEPRPSVKPKAALLCLILAASAWPVARAVEPLAEPIRGAQSRGLDLQRSMTVTFEWRLGAGQAPEETVRQILQAQGFSWTRTEARENLQSAPKVSISVSRSGTLNVEVLSKAMKSVNGLVSGSGSNSWSISQQN